MAWCLQAKLFMAQTAQVQFTRRAAVLPLAFVARRFSVRKRWHTLCDSFPRAPRVARRAMRSPSSSPGGFFMRQTRHALCLNSGLDVPHPPAEQMRVFRLSLSGSTGFYLDSQHRTARHLLCFWLSLFRQPPGGIVTRMICRSGGFSCAFGPPIGHVLCISSRSLRLPVERSDGLAARRVSILKLGT
jgi:hypothetical protein